MSVQGSGYEEVSKKRTLNIKMIGLLVVVVALGMTSGTFIDEILWYIKLSLVGGLICH